MKILYLGVAPYALKDFLEKDGNEVICTSDKVTPGFITENKIDLCISYRYRHIIGQNIIDESGDNIINLHISLLPWNRGSDPNLWSFLEDTPKGVTIHHVDAGVDTGDIIFQKEVFFGPGETLSSSYQTLNTAIVHLFMENCLISKTSDIHAKNKV